MLISELPDDCLLAIFDHINNIYDLISCFKVCIKWSHLIAQRNKKVKYLIELYPERDDCVYYRGIKQIDGTYLNTEFPNLIVEEKRKHNCALVKNQESMQGPINSHQGPIEKYRFQLKMVSFDLIEPKIQHEGSSVKQLFRVKSLDQFKKDAHLFLNLERLNVYDYYYSLNSSLYEGPVLEKLKIAELAFFTIMRSEVCYDFQLIDSCPNLQSAFIVANTNRFFFDGTLKHKSLQDLVLTGKSTSIDWNDLERLLMKYPNLKHLALWRQFGIKDEHIKQLVHMLPNLVLLDVRGCRWVTHRAAKYIRVYCELYERSIKFYFRGNYHEIESDWPQLSTNLEYFSRGFDFMKHCFLKKFRDLPHFLVPIDD
uniref:F-box domain-containing protein n=1 Tax=Tetranychus urticae TaxID=32264 RepID=T1L693_TETUR